MNFKDFLTEELAKDDKLRKEYEALQPEYDNIYLKLLQEIEKGSADE